MANPRYIQAQSFTLQSSGANIGDTSITVQSLKYSDGVTNIVTADLGDQCYATLEPNNGTQEEAIQFTGVTQNSSGTATLTGVSSLGFKYPYSVTSGLSKSHAGGITMVISNDAAFYGNIISYINTVVASGAPTATDTVAGITKLSNNLSSNPRARSTLVSQNGTGAMNLLINSFSYQNGGTAITFTGKMLAYINGIAGSTFTAPASNPRYDLIVYRPTLSDCTSITGTENSSPILPTPMSGDIVLASIYQRVGEVKILERDDTTDGYIFSWYEPTPYIPTTIITNDFVSNGSYDQSQTVTNGTQAVGQANATTKASIVAQKFVPTVPHISGVSLWKIADTGSFTGSVKVSLQADSSGNPSGIDLASYTVSNVAWLKLPSAAEFTVSFSTEYEAMIDGSSYWVVVTPSTSDNSNHPNLGINTAGGYVAGALKYNNSTDGWVLVSTSMLYFKENEGVLGKIPKTNLTSGLLPQVLSPYSLISTDTTNATITNSTAETTVFSKQFAGGLFTLNSGIRVRVGGNIVATKSTGASAATTVKIKYNGTVISTVTTPAASGANNSTNAFQFMYDTSIVNANSLSAQTATTSFTTVATDFNLVSGTIQAAFSNTGIQSTLGTSADVSQPGLLEITFTLSSATATINTTYTGSIIEKIG